MSTLPFVVQPRLKPIIERLGNEESGIIEIERKGYLTAGEKAFLQQGMGAEQVSVLLISLIRKISKEFDISITDAHDVITDCLEGRMSTALSEKVNKKHRNDLDNITHEAINMESRRGLLQATCMLLYRVDPNLPMEYIVGLHPTLLAELAALCQDEDNRSTERLVDSVEDTATNAPVDDKTNDILVELEKK